MEHIEAYLSTDYLMLPGMYHRACSMITMYHRWLPVLIAVAAMVFTFTAFVPHLAHTPVSTSMDNNFGGKDLLRDSICILIGLCCIPLSEIILTSPSWCIVHEVDFRVLSLLLPPCTFALHVTLLICQSSHISEAFFMTISLSHSIIVVFLFLAFLIQFHDTSRSFMILSAAFCAGIGIILHITNFYVGRIYLTVISSLLLLVAILLIVMIACDFLHQYLQLRKVSARPNCGLPEPHPSDTMYLATIFAITLLIYAVLMLYISISLYYVPLSNFLATCRVLGTMLPLAVAILSPKLYRNAYESRVKDALAFQQNWSQHIYTLFRDRMSHLLLQLSCVTSPPPPHVYDMMRATEQFLSLYDYSVQPLRSVAAYEMQYISLSAFNRLVTPPLRQILRDRGYDLFIDIHEDDQHFLNLSIPHFLEVLCCVASCTRDFVGGDITILFQVKALSNKSPRGEEHSNASSRSSSMSDNKKPVRDLQYVITFHRNVHPTRNPALSSKKMSQHPTDPEKNSTSVDGVSLTSWFPQLLLQTHSVMLQHQCVISYIEHPIPAISLTLPLYYESSGLTPRMDIINLRVDEDN